MNTFPEPATHDPAGRARTMHLRRERTIDAPAPAVWALVADYGRDPEWRKGVETMAPRPDGPVRPGTTTAEVVRFAGRIWHNDGVVTDVDEGIRFEWRTTSGVVAHGTRSVEPVDEVRCRVSLELHVTPRGTERLMAPLLRWMLAANLEGDLRRLADLAAQA